MRDCQVWTDLQLEQIFGNRAFRLALAEPDVTEVLMKFFHKNKEEASQIMLHVHQKGQGIAGIYPYEIAETKVAQVIDYSRSKGFPLLCTAEPIDEV